MNRAGVLNQAVKQFEVVCKYCTPKKYRSKSGYDYLICHDIKDMNASVHVNTYFEYTSFSYYSGNYGKLSTLTELSVGDIVFYKNLIFAVKNKLLFNETMGLNHYEIVACSEYFANFIVLDKQIENEILGSDCTRYLLELKSDIPLIPAKLEPQDSNQKFISFYIVDTIAHSMPNIQVVDGAHLLIQAKQDTVTFYAINLNTQELQDFIVLLTNNNLFGYAGMPAFKQSFDTFKQSFNIKANIHELTLHINYAIDVKATAKEHVIDKINFNLFNLTKEYK